jgi:TRAP-type mannitol/chloroaromatic compound transport system permease small subunit
MSERHRTSRRIGPVRAERLLLGTADRIDALNDRIGQTTAVLFLATVVVCFATVYLRYALGIGMTWLQELYMWTHAAAIMFGAGYCLLKGGFVRIDMFYARMSERRKAMVDLFGTVVFMAPFLWMMAAYGWPFFASSLKMNEASQYADGLPRLYLLKGTFLVFVALVGLQGVSLVCRSLVALRQQPGDTGGAA